MVVTFYVSRESGRRGLKREHVGWIHDERRSFWIVCRTDNPDASFVAAGVAVTGGIILRFHKIEGDYLIGFLLLQVANATFAAGQVLCRQMLTEYPTEVPLHNFFGHIFLGPPRCTGGSRAARWSTPAPWPS